MESEAGCGSNGVEWAGLSAGAGASGLAISQSNGKFGDDEIANVPQRQTVDDLRSDVPVSVPPQPDALLFFAGATNTVLLDAELDTNLSDPEFDQTVRELEPSPSSASPHGVKVVQEEHVDHDVDTLEADFLRSPVSRRKERVNNVQWCPRLFTGDEDEDATDDDATDDEDGEVWNVRRADGLEAGGRIDYHAVGGGEGEGGNEGDGEGAGNEDAASEGSSDAGSVLGNLIRRGAYGCPAGRPFNARLAWFRILITAATCVCGVVSVLALGRHINSSSLGPAPEPAPPAPPNQPLPSFESRKCPYIAGSKNNGRLFRLQNETTFVQCKAACRHTAGCHVYSWAKSNGQELNSNCMGCDGDSELIFSESLNSYNLTEQDQSEGQKSRRGRRARKNTGAAGQDEQKQGSKRE
jgi:hypothetical protein